MPYYLRLFTTKDDWIPLNDVAAKFPDECHVEVVENDARGWQDLLIKTKSGDDICRLERTSDDLAADEILEFKEDLAETRPRSGAKWVLEFLSKANVIYACQVIGWGTDDDERSIPGEVIWSIAEILRDGILHAEGEGFTNEEGYQVTWEFSPGVTRAWNMAVLGEGKNWTCFEMDLGNKEHREAFLDGRVPTGVKLI